MIQLLIHQTINNLILGQLSFADESPQALIDNAIGPYTYLLQQIKELSNFHVVMSLPYPLENTHITHEVYQLPFLLYLQNL